MDKKLRVGILGATGMVGQRFVTLLADHPWFEVVSLAASSRSAGKSYREATEGRWQIAGTKIPTTLATLPVHEVVEDAAKIAKQVDLVFSALDMPKDEIKRVEEMYAGLNVAVVSNNSAHRWTEDVPMVIPEVNPDHLEVIHQQRIHRGWSRGLIAVKPNCSIQSYVPVLHAVRAYRPTSVRVTSMQAISGAGKTFASWPEMVDNVIPYIGGEEEKSEREPLKIWGELQGRAIQNAHVPKTSATCIRVPVSDGHMASVSVTFERKPTREEFISALEEYRNPLQTLELPSAPKKFLCYFNEDVRPQTRLDVNREGGMSVSVGRLREDVVADWSFVALSHNTLRGAAGGAVLIAELLLAKKYIG